MRRGVCVPCARKLDYIKYNGKLEIHNSLLNVVLYDKPENRTKDHARRQSDSSDKAV